VIVRTYTAKRGLSEETAQRIGSFIDTKFPDGKVKAPQLVAAATPKRSPIHGDFEWDNDVAAHAHRLEQARSFLRHIEVVYEHRGDADMTTRAFHHVVVDRGAVGADRKAYVSSRIVWETPDYAAQVVETARRELEAWAARYRQYEVLAGVVEVVDGAIGSFPQAA